MSALRIATKHTRTLSQILRSAPAHTRSFYSPFAVLAEKSPLTNPPASASTVSSTGPSQEVYEHEHRSGTVYVVSEPDPSDRPYAVPAGAYPTSAPYVNFMSTEAPTAHVSSSTSSSVAHPTLTRRAPQNEAGVGESAAVRYRSAPGEMGGRGGGDGGLGLMDEATTRPGEGELASRNPPPIQDVGEDIAKLGIRDAWKATK
ncbi:hypothetical protein BV25DRAFT_1909047 [Artomyces pyxidatus]|uniref:Uncharacterized protein n=1 Tax=Artomyces pyxidatus TaxID=48021 RepID=A0ACB8SSM8_9AGAM|nr:hypothetical protein BV25DRAFT_1909047 [Artomyces pyxidatus]